MLDERTTTSMTPKIKEGTKIATIIAIATAICQILGGTTIVNP